MMHIHHPGQADHLTKIMMSAKQISQRPSDRYQMFLSGLVIFVCILRIYISPCPHSLKEHEVEAPCSLKMHSSFTLI